MAEMNDKRDSGMGQCPMCGGSGMMGGRGCCGYHGGMMMGHGFGWGIVRAIIGLVVLGIVFSVGVLIGELKIIVGGDVPHWNSMMGSYSNRSAYPMMGYGVWGPTGVSATSTTVR